MSELLEQVRETARMKLSYATEKSYVQTIRRYILFHNNHSMSQKAILTLSQRE